jgi:hypothetical protein
VKSTFLDRIFRPKILGSHDLNCFWFELMVLSKNQIENMSLQIAVTTGRAKLITPWHEVENFKAILVQSSEAACV